MSQNNLPQSDSSNNSPAPQEQTFITRRLLLLNLAAGAALFPFIKNGNVRQTDADVRQMDIPADLTDEADFCAFNEMVDHLVALRDYIIHTPRPVDPYKLIRLHDEAEHDAGDLHHLLGTRDFERTVLLTVVDPAAYQAAVEELYPEPPMETRPDVAPDVAEAEEMSPVATKEFWLETHAKMLKLANQALENAQALG